MSSSTAFTKVAVALGSNELDDIEVIDLASDQTNFQNLPKFPYPNYQHTGGLGNGNNPIICGGYENNNSACYTLENGIWKLVEPLNEGRYLHAICKSPFQNDGSTLFVTGGKSDYSTYSKSPEVRNENGWETTTPMPIEVIEHSAVKFNSTSVMVIGGRQGTSEVISDKTYIFNSLDKLWTEGPLLKKSRYLHVSGMIRKNSKTQEKVIIVVGGCRIDEEHAQGFMRPALYLDSTEILDTETSEWRSGPQLPMAISSSALVEDADGGVVLIGGFGDGKEAVKTLYRLSHAEGEWVKMTQELKTPRWFHSAFFIPDDLTTSC